MCQGLSKLVSPWEEAKEFLMGILASAKAKGFDWLQMQKPKKKQLRGMGVGSPQGKGLSGISDVELHTIVHSHCIQGTETNFGYVLV